MATSRRATWPTAWRASGSTSSTYPIDLRLPGGETLEEVRLRVRSALDDIMLLHDGKVICLVAHSVSMAIVKHELQGLSLSEALATLPANASWERILVPTYDVIRSARLAPPACR